MDYKVIATILTDTERASDPLDAAIALAARMDAHLDIHAVVVDHTSMAYDLSGMVDAAAAAQTRDALAEREKLESWLQERMRGEAIRWSVQAKMVQSVVLGTYLVEKLRFCDLVVLGRPYQDDPELATLVETCLFVVDRPVLMIPKGGDAPKPGSRVVLGWNEGAEALSAARAALPFLRIAAETDICVIDPPALAPGQSDPGSGMAQYLTRHGARPNVAVMAPAKGDVADTLLQHARDTDAGLIVSGAYGHSRLREAIFGGTTRSLLEKAQVPVLMAR